MLCRMFGEPSSLVAALLFLHVSLPAALCQTTGEPKERPPIRGGGGVITGGLKSVLEDAVSPAFGATIIIIITVVVSGSAYLCFLKYVCAGCCKPTQVAPAAANATDPNKVEEQV